MRAFALDNSRLTPQPTTNNPTTARRATSWALAALLAALLAGCGGGGSTGPAQSQGAGLRAPVESMTLGSPVEAPHVPTAERRAAAGGGQVALDALVPVGPLRAPKAGEPRRTGYGRDVPHTDTPAKTAAQLAWRPLAGGGLAGQITFTSPKALGVRLGLLALRLPADATLRFYALASPATLEVPARDVLAVLERNRAAGDGSAAGRLYWSPQVDGDSITMEVELPPGVPATAVELAVPRLSHLFRDPLAKPGPGRPLALGESAACEADVSCHAWSAESNAVARMSFVGSDGGSYWCSGTLLNDRASSGTPYFLTAHHCISRQAVASTLETNWFFRSSACNSGALQAGTRTLRGGATLLWTSAATDTAFLQLAGTPPPGATYAAWSPDTVALGADVAGLHHPRGDLQKISLGSVNGYGACRTTDASGNFSCSQATQSSGEFLNVRNSLGITEGGSSGSALFQSIGASRYVVGQLYGGNSSCSDVAGSNYYGRFDVAYNAGLHQWLDGSAGIALAVSRAGAGQGTVTSAPAGVSCGATCTAPFAAGTTVTLSAAAAAGSVFAGWSGACSGTGVCTVSMTRAQSVVATFSVPLVPLSAAADSADVAWSTGGSAPFAAQGSVVSYGASALQSGTIGHSQSSWLMASVSGPGLLAFDWKVSSEPNYDFLTVSIDGVKQGAVSGEAGWTRSALQIPAGPHTVRWQYTKDQAVVSGHDAAWVDHVVFTPDTAMADAARLFGWAESAFPAFFAGTWTAGSYQGYSYRHYPQTGNYLAVRDGRVVVHNGATWNFLDVGALDDYLASASAAGF